MNPVMSSETVRIVHDAMVRDHLAHQRYLRTPNILRHGVAVLLVALGSRLDPSVRRPAGQAAPAPRLRAA
jgi:hypothetical protein